VLGFRLFVHRVVTLFRVLSALKPDGNEDLADPLSGTFEGVVKCTGAGS
jgi:hypothetical protein